MKKATSVLALCMVLCLTMSTVFGQMPRSFSYQGYIVDAANTPVTGIHQIKITLYDSPFGGEILHSETFNSSVNKGIFSVIIGSQIVLPPTVIFNRQYWLGLSIDNGSEMTPRSAILSVPYAIHAETANSASTITGGFAGDVSGPADKTCVDLIQGNAIHTEGIHAPTAGQVFSWDVTDMAWEPKFITNSMLESSNVTLKYGLGISGDSYLPLGGTLNLNNTGVLSVVGSGLITSSGGQNPMIGFTPGTYGQVLITNSTGPFWTSLSTNVTMLGDGIRFPFEVNLAHPNIWLAPQTFPDGSITNTELANSNIFFNYGTGISGDASVTLGSTLNLANTGVLSVGGSGLITSSGGQDPIIGLTTGLDGQVLTTVVGEVTSASWNTLTTDLTMMGNGTTIPFGIDLSYPNTWTGVQTFPPGSITNSQLQNDGVTISSGTGTINGGYLSLGGSLALDINVQHDISLVGNGSDLVLGISVQHDATLSGDGNGTALSVNLGNPNTWIETQTFPDASITNAELVNSGLTITTGTGLSGGGAIALGGIITLDANIQHDATLTGNGTTDSKLAIDLTNSNIWTGTQTVSGAENFVYTGNGEADGYVMMTDAAGVASWKPVTAAAPVGVLKESYIEVSVGAVDPFVIPDGYTVVVLEDATSEVPFNYTFPSGVNGQKLYIYNMTGYLAQNPEYNVTAGTMTQFMYAFGAWKHIVN